MVSTELILPSRAPIRVYGGKHPLTNEHRQVEVRAGATIAEALEVSIASTGVEWPFERFIATVNDVRVPREHWDRVRPKPGTMVVFRPVASGDQALRSLLFLGVAIAAMFIAPFIAGPALLGLTGAALTAGTAIIGGAITIGGALLLNALIPIRPAALDSAQPKTLPMISGASNEVRPWGAIPVVLGRHRLSPMFASMPYSHFTGAKQYMTLLFCCGYGRVKISDLRIGETKIGQFEEIDLEIDEGNDNENKISIFKRSVDEQPLSITLKSADKWVTRTTNSKSVRILSLDLIAANGIWKFNKSNGKYVDAPVIVNVQYRKFVLGQGAEVGWIARPDIKFTLNRDTFRKGDQWKVPVTQYEVRVRKATTDYKGPDQVADTIVWQTLRGFENTVPIIFPKPLALVCMEARGSDQFNGVISTFNCVVESYVKHWDGAAWVNNQLSSNPGDLFRHVLQGPANARPRKDAQVDFDSIQLWAEDCAARGYTYNSVVTDQRTVREVLGDIAAAGRATVALRNGKWGVSFPRDQDAVSWHFTPRNSSGMKTQRTYRELPHALRVRWINAQGNKNWRQEEGIVYNDTPDGSGTNGMYGPVGSPKPAQLFETVEFPGITNWNHVHKAARYQLAQALLRPETHTLTADVESLRLERGDKVIMSTDTLLIGTGYGRATKVDVVSQVVTVDSRVIMETGKSYQVKFTLPDGSFLTRNVLNTANETDLLRLDAVDVLPLQSLQSIIASQDVATGLKLLLEAGNLWSWSGKGNKWLDESGNGYDFFRGIDGAVAANDPTFVGTPGAQTAAEYWSFDGGDFFTLDQVNPNWVNALHKDSAKATGIFVFYQPVVGTSYFLCGNFSNNVAKVGFELLLFQDKLTFAVGNGTAYALNRAATATFTTVGWHVAAFSIDEAASPTGTLTFLTDGVPQTITGISYATPSTAAASYTLQIGAAGNNAGALATGFRLRAAALWQGVALTGPQLLAIRDAIVASNDLLPPVGALFSFGERTKVTNTYRVLDVRPGGDLSAQFVLVDDANIHDQYDQEPVPEYDSAISEQPDPFSMVPKGLTIAEFFSGSGITAKATIQLTVQITRVGTIRMFEFQYRDISTNGIRPMVPVFDPETGLPVLDPPVTGTQVQRQIENDGHWMPFATVNAPLLMATKDNLEAGLWEFRVRALYVDDGIASTNDSSSWVYATNSSGGTSIDVLSTDTPPPSISGGLRVNIQGDILVLEWDATAAINVAFYRVKYNPATDGGATWGNSNVLLTTIDTRAVTATRSGTFMVKTVSYSGIEAEEELEHIVVTSPPSPPNILEVFSEAPYAKPDGTIIGPSFPGYHSSTQVQGLLLTLAFAPSGGNYITGSGFYRFFQYIDLGSVYTSRITANVSASGISAGDTMDHWTSLAAVTALDTTDPSDWSIEMQYAASDGPTGKKSVIQRITDLNLTTGLKLVLESANSASWPGTGQKWLDVTPGTGHYDFFLGLDGTVSATNDPIFTGTAPSSDIPNGTLLRTNSYWSFNGSRYFTYDAVNEPWMNNIHKDGAKASGVFSFYVSALGTTCFLYGNSANDITKVGSLFCLFTNKLHFKICNGTGVAAYAPLSTLTITAVGWHTAGFSIDEAAGTLTFMLDGQTQTLTLQSYTTPSTAAATYTTQIGAAGNNATPVPSTFILAAVAMWEGVALSAADLASIGNGIQTNDNWVFGPWTPFSVSDVTGRIIIFGIRLKGSPDGSVSPAVSHLGVTVDMPDRHLGFDIKFAVAPFGSGLSPNGYTIKFEPAFKKLKSIALANYNLDTGDGERYVITPPTTLTPLEQSVTITFYNKNGLPIDKTFSLHAYGYGSVIKATP